MPRHKAAKPRRDSIERRIEWRRPDLLRDNVPWSRKIDIEIKLKSRINDNVKHVPGIPPYSTPVVFA